MDISTCDDYNPDNDWIYLNCSTNQDPQCWRLRDLHTAWSFSTSPMVIVVIVLSIFALIFNLIYTILIHIIWVREKFKGHKRHIFVANRSIVTLMTLTILYTTLILWSYYGFGYETTSILLVIAACDYMTIACNFFIVTILMYVAVVYPIFYSKKFMFRDCVMLGWGLSAVAMIMGIIVGLGGSALFFPSESFLSCPVGSCQLPFAISILSLISAGYLLMMICYLIVIQRLKNRIDQLAIFTLRVSFVIISIVFLPTISIFIVVMVNFDNFSALGDYSANPCSRLERSSVLLLCCYLVSGTVIFWLIGMIIDPIFNTVTEAKMYEHFATFRRLRKLVTQLKPTSVSLIHPENRMKLGAKLALYSPSANPYSIRNTLTRLENPALHSRLHCPYLMDLSACEDFDPNQDYVFLNCSFTEDTCFKLKDLHTAWNFSTSPMAITIIVMSVFTLSLSLIYTTLICVVLSREKFKGHKRTAIVADRSAATILTILLLYVTLIIWHTTGFDYVTTSIIFALALNDYLWIANNFFVITILMYVAVMKPIFYSTRLKFRHCFMIGWMFSVGSVTMSIVFGLGATALLFPSDSIFACPVSTCQYPFAIAILSLLCLGYFLILLCYLVLDIKLRKRIDKTSIFSFRVSFGVITIVYLSAITTYTIAVWNFDDFSGLGESFSKPCSRLENGSSLLLCCNLVGITAICWLIGMTIDAIFNIATEAKLYEHFHMLRRLKKLLTRSKPTVL